MGLDRKDFDPLSYIENAFLDRQPKEAPKAPKPSPEDEIEIPSIGAYMNGKAGKTAVADKPAKSTRFRRTEMRAPRPRRAKQKVEEGTPAIDPALQSVWETLPKNIEFLCSFFNDKVTANYYGGEFRETRTDLIKRLLDPELSLEETSRLLGVCPATVRRYTNRKWLNHHRTAGGQRRFRLSDIVGFVQEHGRFPEE
jgi:excisionase family DNA binding protein